MAVKVGAGSRIAVREAMLPSLTDHVRFGGPDEDGYWDDAMDAVLDSRPSRSGGCLVPEQPNIAGAYRFRDKIVLGQMNAIVAMHAGMTQQSGTPYPGTPCVFEFPLATDGIVTPNDAAVTARSHQHYICGLTFKGSGQANGKRAVWLRRNVLGAAGMPNANVGLPIFERCMAEYFSTGFDGDNTTDSATYIDCWSYYTTIGFNGGGSNDHYRGGGVWENSVVGVTTGAAGARLVSMELQPVGLVPAVSLRGPQQSVALCDIAICGTGVLLGTSARGARVALNTLGTNDGESISGNAVELSKSDGSGAAGDVERCVVAHNAIRSWGADGVSGRRAVVAYTGARDSVISHNTMKLPAAAAVLPGGIELKAGVTGVQCDGNDANDTTGALVGREWIDANAAGVNTWGAHHPPKHAALADLAGGADLPTTVARVNSILALQRAAGMIPS